MRISLLDPSLFTLPYDCALAGGLAEIGHRVTVFGRRPGENDNDLGSIDFVPHFYKATSGRLAGWLPGKMRLGAKGVDHLASMLRLPQALRRHRPDIIHFQWLPLPAIDRHFVSGLRRIAPLVLTVHDTNPFNGDPSARLQQSGFVTALKRFNQLIVHTEQGRKRLIAHGIAPDRLHVIPHGSLAAPASAPCAPDAMLVPLTLLLFGKIKPYKGLDLLIEAFARLPAALQAQAKIHVIGKAYMDLEPLRTLAEQKGVAERLEWDLRFVADDEIEGLFARPGTIAVFPYREIEASGVLSFALSKGRPIIAAALGNFVETITDGQQGLLVPPDDIPALTNALARMIADRPFAAACSAQACALAAATPGWNQIGQQTASVYNQAKTTAPPEATR